jgi:predicted nuclease of predicted toxin-antitoxin system
MRLLADENCDAILIARMRAEGHDVRRVVEFARGADDRQILSESIQDDRALLTHDLDFGLLSDRSVQKPPAIILMRLEPLRAAKRADIVVKFLRTVAKTYRGKFYVIEPGNVRARIFHSAD